MPETSPHSPENAAQDDVAPSPAPLPAVVAAAPTSAGLPAHLEQLADRARDYVAAASSANTRRAYASDWKHFGVWCRRQNLSPLPPDPQIVGLYVTACASGAAAGGK